MRRADRLFQIVQLLRARRLTTARWLAERLQVSERTVYRDVRDLMLSGVPIEGEAGIGYVLRHKLDLPPLAFDRAELDALKLGARMVSAWGDPALAHAAELALAKIRTALPDELRQPASLPVYVPDHHNYPLTLLGPLRDAIAKQQVIELHYCNESGINSSRSVFPLGLFFWGDRWTLVAWCELRNTHRQFRLDRINAYSLHARHYILQPHQTLSHYLKHVGANEPFPD
ncbi:helix-turn-helix transcriptional regulator [Chitinimonas sp.]|uniref:helix-turn-helix transcriptional regulator n=1 Tax=Chitinimonas sp. TaxID=1934313 RepID=UPI0035B1822F